LRIGNPEDQKTAMDLTPSPQPHPPGFDTVALLGSTARDVLGASAGAPLGLAIDLRDRRLAAILGEAAALTRAESASIMLIDMDGEHLRIAAAKGLDEHTIATVRRRIGEGIAGQAFATRNPAISRGQLPMLAEMDGHLPYRIAASVPVMISGRSVGVLSVNATAEETISNQDILLPLGRLARELPVALLAAIDLRPIPPTIQRTALLCLIDRLMSLDEALPTRLAAFAECLRKMVGAERVRFYLLDAIGGEFEEITPHHRSSASGEGTRSGNADFLGKVMRQGYPVVLEPQDKANVGKTATICYPIRCSNLHSVIVLENIPIEAAQEQVLSTLQEVIEQLESMISIEENLAVQELVSELHMRIADLESQLETRPTAERAQALLALALDLVAAEFAIWIPNEEQAPSMTPPITPDAVRIQKWVLGNLKDLADWARANGAAAQGVVARSWDGDAPEGPAPYVAIPDQRKRSVLLAFFAPAEVAEASRQVPSHVVWQILSRVCSLMVEGRKGSAARLEPVDVAGQAHRVFSAPMFSELVHHECMRSRRYGHTCSMIRVQLAEKGRKADRGSRILLEFLLRTTRGVDLISEIQPGVFVVLFPETKAQQDVILERLGAKWRSQHPDIELEAEQRHLPDAGELEATYHAWLTGDGPTSKAA